MKLTATLASLAVLSAAFVGNVSATSCYRKGELLQIRDAAYHFGRACRGYDGKKGSFQGPFKGGETKSTCVNHNGDRFNFYLENREGHTRDLTDDGCVKEFTKIMNDCRDGWDGRLTQGGVNLANGNWWFR